MKYHLLLILIHPKRVRLLITDMSGKMIHTIQYDLTTKGKQIIQINTVELNNGIYTVQLMDGVKLMESLRFVKQ